MTGKEMVGTAGAIEVAAVRYVVDCAVYSQVDRGRGI